MISKPADPEHRELWLDGVRGLAILLVLCSHYFHFRPDGWAWAALNAGMRAGWIGVDLFFVLSGFLITGILIRARGGEHYFRNFYARRALRIFPAYYLYLAIVFLLVVPLDDRVNASGIGDWAPSHLLYIQNMAMVQAETWVPWYGAQHLWSLAIEEQFYWVWPLLVFLVPARWLGKACLVVMGVAWSAKLTFVLLDSWPPTLFLHTLCRMDGLAAGSWVAVRQLSGHQRKTRASAWLILFVMTVLFAAVWNLNPILGKALSWMLAPTAAALGFAAALHLLSGAQAQSPARRLLSTPQLRFFGKYSYGLYVIHLLIQQLTQPVIVRALEFLPHNAAALTSGLIMVAVALATAMALFHTVENPVLSLKRYFRMPTSAETQRLHPT